MIQESGLIPAVELFHWNPRRSRTGSRLTRRFGRRVAVNNFGDLLGPVIVRGIAAQLGIDLRQPKRSATLLSVGSVIHLAPANAVVWGSGINGKVRIEQGALPQLDVRAVRGPWTRDFLLERGIAVPPVYGDPALLLPTLRPDLVARPKRRELCVIPNLNDVETSRGPFVDPRGPLESVLTAIAESELVVGSSLHAIIVAEALGVPARLVDSAHESPFKYADYYAGTGRSRYSSAATVRDAASVGGEPPPRFDSAPLLAAFPRDLWHSLRSP